MIGRGTQALHELSGQRPATCAYAKIGRATLVTMIFGGTTEIQKEIIARGLGL